MSRTTEDDFLGGRIRLRQSADGYRAGIDPVLLAASVPARPGDSVLDLGTGAGAALFCLMARVRDLAGVGIERQEDLAALAAENAKTNGFSAEIIRGDLANLPPELRARSFDHVMANPPFFNRRQGSAADRPEREGGRGVDTPLANWIETAVRRLKPGGSLSLIHRAEQLPEVLGCLDDRMGKITVLPIAARAGRPAKLALIQARKGANTPFRLLQQFIMHDGSEHVADGDDYSAQAVNVLRHAEALDLDAFIIS